MSFLSIGPRELETLQMIKSTMLFSRPLYRSCQLSRLDLKAGGWQKGHYVQPDSMLVLQSGWNDANHHRKSTPASYLPLHQTLEEIEAVAVAL